MAHSRQKDTPKKLATQRNQVVISLLIYQGLRLTEITRIRLQDIDLEEHHGEVPPKRPGRAAGGHRETSSVGIET